MSYKIPEGVKPPVVSGDYAFVPGGCQMLLRGETFRRAFARAFEQPFPSKPAQTFSFVIRVWCIPFKKKPPHPWCKSRALGSRSSRATAEVHAELQTGPGLADLPKATQRVYRSGSQQLADSSADCEEISGWPPGFKQSQTILVGKRVGKRGDCGAGHSLVAESRLSGLDHHQQ